MFQLFKKIITVSSILLLGLSTISSLPISAKRDLLDKNSPKSPLQKNTPKPADLINEGVASIKVEYPNTINILDTAVVCVDGQYQNDNHKQPFQTYYYGTAGSHTVSLFFRTYGFDFNTVCSIGTPVVSGTFSLEIGKYTNVYIRDDGTNNDFTVTSDAAAMVKEVTADDIDDVVKAPACSPNPAYPYSYVYCDFYLKLGPVYDVTSSDTYPVLESANLTDKSCYVFTSYIYDNMKLTCYFTVPADMASYGTKSVYINFTAGQTLSVPITISLFDDVPADHIFAKYIYGLKQYDYVSGYPDNTFHPQPLNPNPDNDPNYGLVTRGAMSKFVRNAIFGKYYENLTCGDFPDVPTNHIFYKEITTLKCEDVISGYFNPDDGKYYFRPEELVTRGAAMKFIVLSARKYREDDTLFAKTDTIADFADVDNTNVFYDYIMGAASYCIVGGYADNTFRPFPQSPNPSDDVYRGYTSRGAMSKMVYNAMNSMYFAVACK